MDKLLKIILSIFSIYLLINAILFMLGMNGYGFPTFSAALSSDYINRVLVPTLMLTLLYFLLRYFTGRSPTSALWPVYVTLFAWLICNLFALLWITEKMPLLIGLCFNAFMLAIIRSAHNKRKNEIF